MFNDLLHLLASFDLISPVWAVLQNIANGPSHTFLIPEGCGWSGNQINGLLKSHGIKTWGLMIVNRLIMVSVRLPQARWAQYLLRREKIPIANGAVPKKPRRSWRDQILSEFEGWLRS